MHLIFIRHGDAGAYTHPDSERQLSDLGRKQAEQTGQWLTHFIKKGVPVQIITSPYQRAKQTATLIGQALGRQIPPDICALITPENEPKGGIQAIVSMIDEVVLCEGVAVVVCHMNIIAKMVAQLTGDTPHAFALAEARVLEGAPLFGEMRLVASYAP